MKRNLPNYLGALLTVVAAPWAMAADTPLDETKTRIALPMDEAPIIDGVINDDEWAQSGNAGWGFRISTEDLEPGDDGITGADLRNGEKPDDDSDLSADLFAGVVGENLYIGVRVIDDDISTDTAEAGSENGQTWLDDSVEVFIDGDNSNFGERDTTGTNPEVVDTGGQFVITANNAYRHAEAGNPRFDPSSGWFAETKVSEGGYHAEFRIPLSLIGNPQPGEHIGFTLAINDDDGGGDTDSVLIWTGLDHVEATFGNLVVGHRRYEALKAAPPTIDGKIEDGEYPGADVVSINPFTGVFRVGDDQPRADDVSFDWRVTHNEDAIYVAVRVTDDVLFSDTAEANSEDQQTWNDDSVEIFFDSNESNLGSRDSNEMFDGQFVFTPNGAWRDNEANNPTYGPDADWWAQATEAADGKSWDVEFLIKKSTLVGGDREDVPMGFNVNINDDDNGGNRETQLNWDGNPHTESSYGELILLSAIPSDPNAVADRSVNFGLLDQSDGARTETLRIRNAGDTQTLTLSDAAISGPNQDVFTLGDFPTSLAPGEEAFATVTFDAGGAKGNYQATLSYKTNDPDPSEADLTANLSARVANLAGPIARWSLDDASGGDMLDISTFDRHGAYTGAEAGDPLIEDGGNSALFAGGGFGEVPGEAFSSFIRFSVSAWVNLNDLSDQQTLFAKGGAGTGVTFALLSSGGDLAWFADGAPEFDTGGPVLTEGTTHHVVITWSTTRAAIYVDGVEVASQDDPIQIEIIEENAFVVGSFFGDPNLSMNGSMDDVQFYDRAITGMDAEFLFQNPGAELTNLPEPENAPVTWSDPNLDTTAADLIGGPSITFVPFAYDGGNADAAFWTGDGGATGNDELDAVYNSHGWNAEGATITLSGLTQGESYMVQFLGAGDTRGCCATRNQAASDGLGNVSGDFPRGNSSVVGTFTAAGTSQDIMIVSGMDNGVDPGLSGIILTDGAGRLISAFNVGREAGDDITVSTVPPAVWAVDEPGTLPADSAADFGGPDVDNGWSYGYRNVPLDNFTENYDPFDGLNQFPETWWGGAAWDEPNDDGDNRPWTTIAAGSSHPNGPNSVDGATGLGELHWTIRRWTSPGGPVEITYSVAKTDPDCGGGGTNGVTAAIHINGERIDSATVAGNDGVGVTRTVNAQLEVGDVVDLVHTPRGTDGEDSDGCDGSAMSMVIMPGSDGGVVSQWSFEDNLDDTGAAGGTADVLTPTGDAEYVPGVVGQAVRITADGLQRLRAEDSDDLELGTNWTLEAFVWPDTDNTGEWDRFWTKWGDGGNQWHTAFRSTGAIDIENGLDLFVNGGDNIINSNTTAEVPLETWSHVAFVGDSGAGTITAWLNGVEVGSTAYVAVEPGDGAMNFGNFDSPANGLQYSGLIDEAAIHNVAATADYLAGRAALIPGGGTTDPRPAPLMDVGFNADGAFSATLPDGVTGDVEYSVDLIEWEVIAPGASGTVTETDADRAAAPVGFYRVKQ